VVRALFHLLPHEHLVYFADTAHIPYGDKNPQDIIQYTVESMSNMQNYGLKTLIIACNTACIFTLEKIRSLFSIPIIGINEQGIQAITKLHPPRNIAILGTYATILSGQFQKEILTHMPQTPLFPIACPLFVPLVERGIVQRNIVERVVHYYLSGIQNENIERVLLACSHFPFLKTEIQRTIGKNAQLIDPAWECAMEAKSILSRLEQINPQKKRGDLRCFVTANPIHFQSLGERLLHLPLRKGKKSLIPTFLCTPKRSSLS
jgi:glutamate racemase